MKGKFSYMYLMLIGHGGKSLLMGMLLRAVSSAWRSTMLTQRLAVWLAVWLAELLTMRLAVVPSVWVDGWNIELLVTKTRRMKRLKQNQNLIKNLDVLE